MTEIADRFNTLAADFDARVQGTTDWSATSPCEGWTAKDVAVHVTNNLAGLVAAANGQAPTPITADDDVPAAWAQAHTELSAVLNDPAKAAITIPSPFGPMPLEQMVGRIMCADVLVHTWDLARATGQDETLNAEGVEGTYSGLKPLDAMIRQPGIFGPKIDAPEGADVQTQLLCFLGRAV